MATGILNGSDLLLQISKNPLGFRNVAYAHDFELGITSDIIDQTNKDSEGWRQMMLGLREWTIKCDALYQNESDPLFNYFMDFYGFVDIKNKLQCQFTIRDANTADDNLVYNGTARIVSLNLKGEFEDQSIFQIFLAGTSQLAEAEKQ
jgi:predicted secreted protein